MAEPAPDRCRRVLGELIEITQRFLAEVDDRSVEDLDRFQNQRAVRFSVLERSLCDATDPEIQSLLRQIYTLDERLIPRLQMHQQKLKADLARHRRLSQALEKMRATGGASWQP